jgi:hypothetical protein
MICAGVGGLRYSGLWHVLQISEFGLHTWLDDSVTPIDSVLIQPLQVFASVLGVTVTITE